jgi:outer membrane protein OmpA-like peptidoglycan-associated protein
MSCDPEEICEECPEWIFTLADLLMCMMGLFVILWVLKPDATDSPEQAAREEIRQQEIIRDIQLAFGASMHDNADRQMRIEQLYKAIEEMKREGSGGAGHAETHAQGAEGSDSEVTTIREGDLAGLGGRVHFPPGEATMSDDAAKAVRQIAGKIRGFRNIVLVKGHTGPDDLPADMPRTGVEARRVAMQLSLERANLVAELLIEHGVSPDILRVQASGSYEPLRRRAYDATDRLMNRRVEVQATDQLTADRAAQEAVVSP